MSKKFFCLLTIVMAAVLSVGFASCSDDDDESGVAGEETLYGAWQQTQGAAFEDGALHHDHKVSADEADYLLFSETGTCSVIAGDDGIFFGNGSFSFSFDAEAKTLKVGSQSFVVDVLSSGTLKLKYYYNDEEYDVATFKKVSNSVWDGVNAQ